MSPRPTLRILRLGRPHRTLRLLMAEKTEADIARMALELSEELARGEEAVCKLAEIEAIIDDILVKYSADVLDPMDPWNTLMAIRKVLR